MYVGILNRSPKLVKLIIATKVIYILTLKNTQTLRRRVKVKKLKCRGQASIKFRELSYLMSVWILFMVVDLCELGIDRNNNQSIKCTSTSSFRHRGREFPLCWLSSRSKQFHSNVRSRNVYTYVDVFKVRTKIRPSVRESWKQKIFTIGRCAKCITVSFNVIYSTFKSAYKNTYVFLKS